MAASPDTIAMTDYYKVLGVPMDAETEVIKQAYCTLAKTIHPNQHSGAEKEKAEADFKKLSEAYAILSDPDKRQVYDIARKEYDRLPGFAKTRVLSDAESSASSAEFERANTPRSFKRFAYGGSVTPHFDICAFVNQDFITSGSVKSKRISTRKAESGDSFQADFPRGGACELEKVYYTGQTGLFDFNISKTTDPIHTKSGIIHEFTTDSLPLGYYTDRGYYIPIGIIMKSANGKLAVFSFLPTISNEMLIQDIEITLANQAQPQPHRSYFSRDAHPQELESQNNLLKCAGHFISGSLYQAPLTLEEKTAAAGIIDTISTRESPEEGAAQIANIRQALKNDDREALVNAVNARRSINKGWMPWSAPTLGSNFATGTVLEDKSWMATSLLRSGAASSQPFLQIKSASSSSAAASSVPPSAMSSSLVPIPNGRLDKLIGQALEDGNLGTLINEWNKLAPGEQWRGSHIEGPMQKILTAHTNLCQISSGDLKPSKAEVEQMVRDLYDGLKAVTLRFGGRFRIGNIALSEMSIDKNSGKDRFEMLGEAIENSPSSFIIYDRYPYVHRDHKFPVQGTVLENDYDYHEVSHLSGDKLKTAILEIMCSQLMRADAESFYDVQDKIKSSTAYLILQSSQSSGSPSSSLASFFSAKATSQAVIDTLLSERAATLGIPLVRPSAAPSY